MQLPSCAFVALLLTVFPGIFLFIYYIVFKFLVYISTNQNYICDYDWSQV